MYNYDGVDYNVGNMLHQLRKDYRGGRLSEDVIKKLEKIGMVWRTIGFDFDNVRISLKSFVQKLFIFKEKYSRYPLKSGEVEGERLLYERYMFWTNFKRSKLSDEEKEYLVQKGILLREKDVVSEHLKTFVKDFLEFYKIHKRNPKFSESIYARWIKWTNPENLNADQKKYLQQHGIEFRVITKNNVGVPVLKFVDEYLEFCDRYKRKPRNAKRGDAGYVEGEGSLYQRWRGWTDPAKILTDEEREYLQQHGIQTRKIEAKSINGVRKSCIEFVERFEDFIQKYKRKPTEVRSCKNRQDAVEGESGLYSMYLEWTDPTGRRKNPTSEEIEYLKQHGIYVREEKKKVGNIRPELIAVVEKYLEFIKTYGRKPFHKKTESTVEGEIKLYANMSDWRNPLRKNLNEDEIRYLEENGFTLSKPKPRKSSTDDAWSV